MSSNLIHDRGRGPEITGTRITVYDLLQSFLDASVTEEELCRVYALTPQQVAAARAYVLGNPDTVLAEHLRIEERMAASNPPEVKQQAERAKAIFERFKAWLSARESANCLENKTARVGRSPTFREWLAENAKEKLKPERPTKVGRAG